MPILTPEFLQELAYATHDEVMNRRDPIIADRQNTPLWGMLMKNKKEMAFTGGRVLVKMQRDGGLGIEHWSGRQTLGFQENRVDVEMAFVPRRTHLGVEFVHTELEDEGYSVEPNATRGKNFAKRLSKADIDRVMNIFEQRIEDMLDAWDTRLDLTFHLDGTQDPLAPIGLDGLLPIDNTAGTIGGQPRIDPLFQHQVAIGSTIGAGGTLERDLQGLIRAAELNNRGTPSKIDAILAGFNWIDGYIAFARANQMPYERVGGSTEVKRMDIGVPDSAIHFNGIPVIHDPTFERLDAGGFVNPGEPAWSNRAYLLSSKTMTFGYAPDKLKKFSAPMDPSDQRVTRLSLDGRHCMLITKPNGNAVNAI